MPDSGSRAWLKGVLHAKWTLAWILRRVRICDQGKRPHAPAAEVEKTCQTRVRVHGGRVFCTPGGVWHVFTRSRSGNLLSAKPPALCRGRIRSKPIWQSKIRKPKFRKSKVRKLKARQSKVRQSKIRKPKNRQSKVRQSEAKKSKAGKSKTEKSRAQQSKIRQSKGLPPVDHPRSIAILP